jgi:hypothetical protein
MESIPNEILVIITSYLGPDERLQCALVCKNWYIGLLYGNLYEFLKFSTTDQCQKAIDYFKSQSNGIQRKVTELKLICNYKAMELPYEFPNVEKLVWTDENFSFQDLMPPTIDGDFDKHIQHWKHIREITEANWHYPITRVLLKSTEAALYLTYIDLSFHNRANNIPDLSHYCSSYHRVRELIPHLKNAKNLSFLRLNKIYLTLQDVEQIHKGTPCLSVMELRGIKIKLKDNDQQTNIQNRYWKDIKVHVKQLCQRVSHLNIELAHDLADFDGEHRALTMWLRYIGIKYTNLTHFYINMDNIADIHAMELYYQKPLLGSKAFSKWKNLTVLDMEVAPLTRALMKAIDSSKIQLKQVTIYFSEVSSHTQLEAITKSKQILSIELMNVKVKRFIRKHSYEGLHLVKLVRSLSSLRELVLDGPCSKTDTELDGLYEDILLLEILKHASTSLLSLTCFGTYIANAHTGDLFQYHQCKISDAEFPIPSLLFRSSLEDLNIVQCKIYNDKEATKFNETLANLLEGCPSLCHFQFTTARTEFTMTSFNSPSAARVSSIQLNLLNQHMLGQIEIDISGENIYEVVDQDSQQKWYLQHNYGEAFIEIPKPMSQKRKYSCLALRRPIQFNGAALSHTKA